MPERTMRDLIADGRVHLFDGAMGTMLYAKGVFINVCYDELNLKAPDLVQEIHEAYVKAGAEILETNTFGANPVKLGHFGLVEETYAINRRAAELARAAAGARALVAGAIGPLGVRLEPFGEGPNPCAFAFNALPYGYGGAFDSSLVYAYAGVVTAHKTVSVTLNYHGM